jgi:hypothetical protein
VGLLGSSSSLAQETSIRVRIKSAEKRIERVVFIEFWLVEFTILSQIVVVSMPVTHENVPAKVTTGLPSYGNYPYDRCLLAFTMKLAT